MGLWTSDLGLTIKQYVILVFEDYCLLFLSLVRDYFYAHPIPFQPGKEWHEGRFGGVGELDDHCKHVLGKEWRVRLEAF